MQAMAKSGCVASGEAMSTACTPGSSMMAKGSLVARAAPVSCATALARAASASEIATRCAPATEPAKMRAWSAPMMPAPMMPTPMLMRASPVWGGE